MSCHQAAPEEVPDGEGRGSGPTLSSIDGLALELGTFPDVRPAASISPRNSARSRPRANCSGMFNRNSALLRPWCGLRTAKSVSGAIRRQSIVLNRLVFNRRIQRTPIYAVG